MKGEELRKRFLVCQISPHVMATGMFAGLFYQAGLQLPLAAMIGLYAMYWLQYERAAWATMLATRDPEWLEENPGFRAFMAFFAMCLSALSMALNFWLVGRALDALRTLGFGCHLGIQV